MCPKAAAAQAAASAPRSERHRSLIPVPLHHRQGNHPESHQPASLKELYEHIMGPDPSRETPHDPPPPRPRRRARRPRRAPRRPRAGRLPCTPGHHRRSLPGRRRARSADARDRRVSAGHLGPAGGGGEPPRRLHYPGRRRSGARRARRPHPAADGGQHHHLQPPPVPHPAARPAARPRARHPSGGRAPDGGGPCRAGCARHGRAGGRGVGAAGAAQLRVLRAGQPAASRLWRC